MVIPTIVSDFQELAAELLTNDLDNFGQSSSASPISVKVRTDTPGATAIDEPSISYTTTQVKAVSRDIDPRKDRADLIDEASKIVIISASGVTRPKLQDLILIGTADYKIVDVEDIPNGEAQAVYKVYLRR